MTSLLMSDFKAKCVEVINGIHAGGEPVIVTRRGLPLAKIVPIIEAQVERPLGCMAGEAVSMVDLVESGFAEDWEALK